MNKDQGTARVVEAWLREGVRALPYGDSIPDPVLGRVIDDVERTPQQTGRMRWLKRLGVRSPTSTRRNRLMFNATGLVAALAVLALGVSVVTTDRTQDPAAQGDGGYTVAQDGLGDFDTITEAVAAAVEGDTIRIGPGTYAEAIVIDKDITVAGDPDDPSAVVIDITSEGPLVETDLGPGRKVHFAFMLQDARATISDLTVTGPSNRVIAFVILGGAPVVSDTVVDFPAMTDWPHQFVYMRDGAAGTIRGNVANALISVAGGASPTFEGNVLGEIFIEDEGTTARLVGNQVESVWLEGGATATLEGNEIGADGADCGIGLEGVGTGAEITSNTISYTQVGVCVEEGASASITGNTLSDLDAAVRIAGEGSVVEGNSICVRGDDAWLGDGAGPELDDVNESCDDGPVS